MKEIVLYIHIRTSLTHVHLGLDPAALILNGLKSSVEQGAAQGVEAMANTSSEMNTLAPRKVLQTFPCSNSQTEMILILANLPGFLTS